MEFSRFGLYSTFVNSLKKMVSVVFVTVIKLQGPQSGWANFNKIIHAYLLKL